LVAELEIFWLQNGAAGVAFSPIVAFGENSSKPHYHPQDRPLREDDAVLIDIGVTLDHYHSDMTRVLLPKDPDPKMVEIYAVVKEAQKRALALCKPKSVVADLDAAARDYITECGYGDHFVHSLGHGIGLEVHEAPRLYKEGADVDLRLEAGMAITIEPGIYLPGIGGVRIEDTVVITNEGHINLTNSPK
ncbi:MAG: M24 family metallopeptidase, partial [Chlamydiae bacterium]|nr:M24 family metallopeptidase [Chlamydiota bacterium]